jgi:hypothetical protein
MHSLHRTEETIAKNYSHFLSEQTNLGRFNSYIDRHYEALFNKYIIISEKMLSFEWNPQVASVICSDIVLKHINQQNIWIRYIVQIT